MPAARQVESPVFPPSRNDLLIFVVSAVLWLAIWWRTAAMQPRYDFSPQRRSYLSGRYMPLMIVAVVVVSAFYAKRWWVVAPGLIAPQLPLSLFTAPQFGAAALDSPRWCATKALAGSQSLRSCSRTPPTV
jgi:hypothetical protein